jgi:hypothetical protein
MSILEKIIKEMAITSSNSIAVNPSAGGEIRRHDIRGDASRREWISSSKAAQEERRQDRIKMYVDPKSKENLKLAKEKLKKKKSMKSKIKKFFGLGESVDLNDVSSRLRYLQTGATDEETVTYGVEDDQGNLMKITVKARVAKDFEDRLSAEIHKNLQFDSNFDKITNRNAPSMAEVLFRLKDEFEIIDVEFPTIPKNTVYKAPGIDMREPDTDVGNTDLDNDLGYEDYDTSDSDTDKDEFGIGDLDLSDDNIDDEYKNNEFSNKEEDLSDDESVEDFSSKSAPKGTEELLSAILKMLQSDAEAKKAQAEAEAEKARALQAEYSAKAASASIEQQKELISMEQEIAKQKQKEKEARKLADLAKFQVKKLNNFTSEAVNSVDALDKILTEISVTDNMQSVMAARRQLDMEYKILPTDDPATKKYKTAARRAAMQELMARMRGVRLKQTLDAEKAQQQQAIAAKEQELANEKNLVKQNQNQQNQQKNNAVAQLPQKTAGSGRLGSMR